MLMRQYHRRASSVALQTKALGILVIVNNAHVVEGWLKVLRS